MIRAIFFCGLSLLAAIPAVAEQRSALGTGRLFTNDQIGDGEDRWRTGSYVLSHIRGPDGSSGTAEMFGDVLEYRFESQIISAFGDRGDRLHVGALSLGIHSHYGEENLEFSLGVDLVAVGPQTGLARFQERFHDAFSLPAPPTDNPLADAFFLNVVAEGRHVYRLSETASVRPFLRVETGAEELIRIGADAIIGTIGQSDLWLRDTVTGQLYPGVRGTGTGFTFLAGADIAAVGGSRYLPSADGPAPETTRWRARTGVEWQSSDGWGVFYGLTWLSEEFVGQTEGQLLGSLHVDLAF